MFLLTQKLTTFNETRNPIIGFCCDTIEVLTDQWVVKSRSVVLSTRRKLGHGVAFYKILTLGAHSIAKKGNLSNQKQPCCTSTTFPKLSVKFQRNRLPNVQDIKVFNVRPLPKFCLINLFTSSLSPAALSRPFTLMPTETTENAQKSEIFGNAVQIGGFWKRSVVDGKNGPNRRFFNTCRYGLAFRPYLRDRKRWRHCPIHNKVAFTIVFNRWHAGSENES